MFPLNNDAYKWARVINLITYIKGELLVSSHGGGESLQGNRKGIFACNVFKVLS